MPPGWVPVERHGGIDPEDLAQHLATVPAVCVGQPADVAAAVRFLAPQAAGLITGVWLPVNGGVTIG